MANFNSVEMDGLDDTPVSYPMAADFGGRVRAQFGTLTFAAQAAGSTLTIARIPKGGRIVGFLMNASVAIDTAGGTATTIAIGVAGATGRFLAAVAYTALGSALISIPVASIDPAVEGIGTKFTDDTDIIITTAAEALPASGTMVFITLYTID